MTTGTTRKKKRLSCGATTPPVFDVSFVQHGPDRSGYSSGSGPGGGEDVPPVAR